jgi:hypothetical protein
MLDLVLLTVCVEEGFSSPDGPELAAVVGDGPSRFFSLFPASVAGVVECSSWYLGVGADLAD